MKKRKYERREFLLKAKIINYLLLYYFSISFISDF